MTLSGSNLTTWLPELIYEDHAFQAEHALVCDDTTSGTHIIPADEVDNAVRLNDRALLPGLVNAHSHAFQRVIRGRTEYRTAHIKDSFWTWREMMYRAAGRLTPEAVYDAS